MLHAGIAHSAMWDAQFASFQKTNQVIRYDQRGFGKTITRTTEFNRREDLRALLDQLNIERAILMGCSMGGSNALDFTLEHPERVSALILIAAGISGTEPPADLRAQMEEQDAAYNAAEFDKLIELELKMWVDGPNRTPAQAPAPVREKIRAMELENLKINTDGFKSIPLDPPARARLREIQAPTLVVIGTGDQPFVIEQAQMLAREIPNAQLLMLEQIGHVPNLEKPDEVNRAIENFLRVLE